MDLPTPDVFMLLPDGPFMEILRKLTLEEKINLIESSKQLIRRITPQRLRNWREHLENKTILPYLKLKEKHLKTLWKQIISEDDEVILEFYIQEQRLRITSSTVYFAAELGKPYIFRLLFEYYISLLGYSFGESAIDTFTRLSAIFSTCYNIAESLNNRHIINYLKTDGMKSIIIHIFTYDFYDEALKYILHEYEGIYEISNIDDIIHKISEKLLERYDDAIISKYGWHSITRICGKLDILMEHFSYQKYSLDTFVIGIICEKSQLLKSSIKYAGAEYINKGMKILANKSIKNIDEYTKLVHMLLENKPDDRDAIVDAVSRSKWSVLLPTLKHLLDEGFLHANDVGKIGVKSLSMELIELALRRGADFDYAVKIIYEKKGDLGSDLLADKIKEIVGYLLDNRRISDVDSILRMSIKELWYDIAVKAIKNGAKVYDAIYLILSSLVHSRYGDMLMLLLENYPVGDKSLMNDVLTFAVRTGHMNLLHYTLNEGADNINEQLKYLGDIEEFYISEEDVDMMNLLMRHEKATDMDSVIKFADKTLDDNIRKFAIDKKKQLELE